MVTRGRLITLALAFAVLLSGTGCATVGRSFNHTQVPSLELGKLKDQEYSTVFGKAWNTRSTTNSDGKFEDIRFLYGSGNLATSAARVLDLEFRNGVLNAWLYISGFDEDRTVVDLTLTEKIRRGVDGQNEVRSVLGNPHGKALCPSLLFDYKDRCQGAEIWAWGATNKLVTLGRNPSESTMIYVLFDSAGTVTQLETVQSKSERRR